MNCVHLNPEPVATILVNIPSIYVIHRFKKKLCFEIEINEIVHEILINVSAFPQHAWA